MVSQRKLAANRRNAAKSTGPRTPAGKRRSSRNALTHGFYCQDLVLEDESQALFTILCNSYLRTLSPQNLLELSLVDQIVSANWRLRRLSSAEAALHITLCERSRQRRVKQTDYPDDEEDELFDEQDSFGPHSSPDYTKPFSLTAPAYVSLLLALKGDDDGALERLARHEQRFQRTIHRCLKELRELRKNPPDDLPPCPYVEPDPDPDEVLSEELELQSDRNEATATPPPASDTGQGEGASSSPSPRGQGEGAPDDPAPHTNEGNKATDSPLSASVLSAHQDSRNEATAPPDAPLLSLRTQPEGGADGYEDRKN